MSFPDDPLRARWLKVAKAARDRFPAPSALATMMGMIAHEHARGVVDVGQLLAQLELRLQIDQEKTR